MTEIKSCQMKRAACRGKIEAQKTFWIEQHAVENGGAE